MSGQFNSINFAACVRRMRVVDLGWPDSFKYDPAVTFTQVPDDDSLRIVSLVNDRAIIALTML